MPPQKYVHDQREPNGVQHNLCDAHGKGKREVSVCKTRLLKASRAKQGKTNRVRCAKMRVRKGKNIHLLCHQIQQVLPVLRRSDSPARKQRNVCFRLVGRKSTKHAQRHDHFVFWGVRFRSRSLSMECRLQHCRVAKLKITNVIVMACVLRVNNSAAPTPLTLQSGSICAHPPC